MKQVELKQGNIKKICWVDRPEELKPGFHCTLKDCEGWWEVEQIFSPVIEKNEINRTWRVGGL